MSVYVSSAADFDEVRRTYPAVGGFPDSARLQTRDGDVLVSSSRTVSLVYLPAPGFFDEPFLVDVFGNAHERFMEVFTDLSATIEVCPRA